MNLASARDSARTHASRCALKSPRGRINAPYRSLSRRISDQSDNFPSVSTISQADEFVARKLEGGGGGNSSFYRRAANGAMKNEGEFSERDRERERERENRAKGSYAGTMSNIERSRFIYHVRVTCRGGRKEGFNKGRQRSARVNA